MNEPDNKKHILIVEDSPDLQALLSRFFTNEGYQVSRAANGLEALDFLRHTSSLPALILLDVMMPVMDGIEFLKLRQNDRRLASIPVIIMTADSNSQSKVDHLHIASFVRKPISDVDALLRTVERLSSTDLDTSTEGEDFYFEDDRMVFTESYLRKRGVCCHSGCRHCPYR